LNSVAKEARSVEESKEMKIVNPSSENLAERIDGTGGSEVSSRTVKLRDKGKRISNSEKIEGYVTQISYSPGGGGFIRLRVTEPSVENASIETLFG
jgi:hypothetical protein